MTPPPTHQIMKKLYPALCPCIGRHIAALVNMKNFDSIRKVCIFSARSCVPLFGAQLCGAKILRQLT